MPHAKCHWKHFLTALSFCRNDLKLCNLWEILFHWIYFESFPPWFCWYSDQQMRDTFEMIESKNHIKHNTFHFNICFAIESTSNTRVQACKRIFSSFLPVSASLTHFVFYLWEFYSRLYHILNWGDGRDLIRFFYVMWNDTHVNCRQMFFFLDWKEKSGAKINCTFKSFALFSAKEMVNVYQTLFFWLHKP